MRQFDTQSVAERPKTEIESIAEFLISPGSAGELVEWIKERLLVPKPEWDELGRAMDRDAAAGGGGGPGGGLEEELDGDGHAKRLLSEASERLVRVDPPGSAGPAVVAIETLPRLTAALGVGLDELQAAPLIANQRFKENPAHGVPFADSQLLRFLILLHRHSAQPRTLAR